MLFLPSRRVDLAVSGLKGAKNQAGAVLSPSQIYWRAVWKKSQQFVEIKNALTPHESVVMPGLDIPQLQQTRS